VIAYDFEKASLLDRCAFGCREHLACPRSR
jgi:hypothetical protein